MIVKHGGSAFIFPDAAVRSARGMFRAERRRGGIRIDEVRARLTNRISWREGCPDRERFAYAEPTDRRVDWRVADRVCSALAPKLIARWLKDGYIERVRRGVYRLAEGSKGL